ncbi:hypothetical protein KN815_01770, partial [Streptomyces sp. 4503]|nr:hypothetical protein [Streptomyces niphimycinicus]
MHIHAYSWLGEKELFDREALRRPPDRPRPPLTTEDEDYYREDQERYRTLLETFRHSELPPLETSL